MIREVILIAQGISFAQYGISLERLFNQSLQKFFLNLILIICKLIPKSPMHNDNIKVHAQCYLI